MATGEQYCSASVLSLGSGVTKENDEQMQEKL